MLIRSTPTKVKKGKKNSETFIPQERKESQEEKSEAALTEKDLPSRLKGGGEGFADVAWAAEKKQIIISRRQERRVVAPLF